jgi:hypothetical protein
MADKARQVVQQLSSKPGLFYEVLRIVADEYEVASPWVELSSGSWIRQSVGRETIATVVPLMNGKYRATSEGQNDDGATLDGAKALADQRLRDAGWMLP